MVRCLSEKEVASLSYKANETASNKCSKYFIGGAMGLYLFVYKPNKQGTSLKKYKLRKRVREVFNNLNKNFDNSLQFFNCIVVFPFLKCSFANLVIASIFSIFPFIFYSPHK